MARQSTTGHSVCGAACDQPPKVRVQLAKSGGATSAVLAVLYVPRPRADPFPPPETHCLARQGWH
eukprot:scaffold2090_cov225-Prasinococcus_capsulatus_cf.AAC.41